LSACTSETESSNKYVFEFIVINKCKNVLKYNVICCTFNFNVTLSNINCYYKYEKYPRNCIVYCYLLFSDDDQCSCSMQHGCRPKAPRRRKMCNRNPRGGQK